MSDWYIMKNQTVQGPYTIQELQGQLKPQTRVCRAGRADWRPAEKVEPLQECLPPTETDIRDDGDGRDQHAHQTPAHGETPDLEPTLSTFRELCLKATNRDLLREYKNFWDEYDAHEQSILKTELEKRGISPEDSTG